MSRDVSHNRIIKLSLALCLSVYANVSIAAPQGGSVVAGEGSVTTAPGVTTINQISQQMVMDWNSFNIAAGEYVRFDQPTASSAALNRIFDQNASQIFGSLTANGNVFLFNSQGFLFGETANVNVGGLVATSLAIDPDDFMSGIYHLASDAQDGGLIVNRGLLHAATGGISLVSDTGVINEGMIYAQRGSVNLATTSVATLDFDGDGLLRLEVSEEVAENLESLESAVSNSGEIHANAGEVLMTGKVARDVFSNVVNNSGIISANSIISEGGVVRLVASGGDTYNSGTIEATSVLSRGGEVQVLGDRVALTGDSNIDVSGMLGGGEVLIGGDYQGSNPDVPNAADVWVGRDTAIAADAVVSGDGGKVIVWADDTTRFFGDISATGGQHSGHGGFVEVSGKKYLDFRGIVNTTAANGNMGTLLLDPQDILIVDANGGGDDSEYTADQTILFADPNGATDFTLSESTLEAQSSNIILQAQRDIVIDDLTTDGVLDFANIDGNVGAEYVVFQAGRDITFTNTANTLQTGGGRIHLEADSSNSPTGMADGDGALTLGNLTSNGGDIVLLGDIANSSFNGSIDAGSGDVSISVSQDAQTLSLGSGGDLTNTDLDQITSSGTLVIGEAFNAGANGDTPGVSAELAQQLSFVGDITLNDARAATLVFASSGTDASGPSAVTGFDLPGGRVLTVDSALQIDADRDNDDLGIADIEGRIVQSNDREITIHADEIFGDNSGGSSGREIISAGIVNLVAAVIGQKNDPFNIDGVTELNIIDTASGDMFLNLIDDQGNDLSFETGILDLVELDALTDFSFTSHAGFSIGTVQAAQRSMIFEAQSGDIGNAPGNLTVGYITLIASGAGGAIGTSLDPFGNINIDNGGSAGSLDANSTNATDDSGGIFIEADGDFDLGTIDSGSGDFEVTVFNDGDLSDSGTITVGGNTRYTLDEDTSILLNSLGNDYTGSVALVAGGSGVFDNVSLTDASAIELSGIETNNNLIIVSGGSVTQATGTALIVGGNASFTSDGDVTLGDLGNDFNRIDIDNGTTASTSVKIVDSNAIDLGTLVIEGTLDITAGDATTAADVTDTSANGSDGISVSGTTTIRAGQNSNILLDDADNAFVGAVSLTQQGVSLGDELDTVSLSSATALNLETLSASGSLTVIADSLTTVGDIDVGGTADLQSTMGDIDLGAALSADTLVLDAAGSITENAGAIVTVTNNTEIDATGSISLTNASNDFSSIDINNNGDGGAVSITDTNSIELGSINAGGDLTVIAGANITDIGDAVSSMAAGQSVSGNATFTTGSLSDLILDNLSNLYAGNLTFNQASSYKNFSFTNTSSNALSLPSMTVTNDLTIVSGGNISQSGSLDIDLLTDITADGSITLTDAGNDFTGAVSLNNSANSAAVNLTDSNNIVLGAVDVGGNFTVTAGTSVSLGRITDTAAQSVVGDAVFNAGLLSDIELDSLNDYQGSVDFNGQAGTLNGLTYRNSGDIDLLALSTTTLDLESTTGGISTNQAVTATGATVLDAAGSISLTNTSNNLQSTIQIIDATDATLVNNNSIQLATTANVSGTLDLTAAGNLSATAITITADTLLIDAATLNTLSTDVNNLGVSLSAVSPINISNSGGFTVDASGITAFNGAITLAAVGSGNISVAGDVENQNGFGVLNLQANSGSLIDAGGVLTNTGNIDLDAQNGIGGSGAPIQTSTTATLFLTTTAVGGDIYVQNDSSLSLSEIVVTTAAGSAQTVSLTATDWFFDIFFTLDSDDYAFISTTGSISVAGGVLFDANSLSLDSATGIGSSLNPVSALDVNTISLASSGSFDSGDIFVDGSGFALGIDAITTDATANSSQQVNLTATGITVNADITTNDYLLIDATSGALDGGGNTLSGASVGLISAGNIDNITLGSRSIAARSNNGLIDIASTYSGSDLIIDDLIVVSGLSTTNNDITLSSQDASIDIATAIDAGATGAVSLTTTESAVAADHDIGGAAQITAGGGLSVNADGGITGITVDAGSSGIDLTSAGNGSGGDINVIILGGMTTSRLNTLDTDVASNQDITLTASAWNINSDLDVGNDNLSLIANTASIVRTSGTLSANDLNLIANAPGAAIGGIAANSDLINIDLSGALTASTADGAGGIFIVSPGSAILVSNTGIDAGTGDVHLYSSASITGNGSISATNLLLDADGAVDLNTGVSRVAIEAVGGNVTLDNTGDLVIGRGTRADLTNIDGINTTGDLNLTATGVIDDTANGSINADDVSITTAGGLTLDSAQHTTNSFGATDTAGGDIVLDHQGLLTLTGLDTTGNVSINNDSAVNANSGVLDVGSLTLQSVGGAALDNAANILRDVSITDSAAGDITLVSTGDLSLGLMSTTGSGSIDITTDGNITQRENIGTDSGDIDLTSTAGSITMQDGTISRTTDGNIRYTTSGGDIAVGLLAAGLNSGTVSINALLGVGSVFKSGTDINAPNVSANTVEITSGSIGQGLDFGFDDDIRGTVTLNYTTTAFVTSAPQGADLNIVDNGPGVFNSSGARSAGNQRGESSGLEDVGFIDTALFSDINLFVVDGTGIGLPEDQSDISPEDRKRFRQLEQDAQASEDAAP